MSARKVECVLCGNEEYVNYVVKEPLCSRCGSPTNQKRCPPIRRPKYKLKENIPGVAKGVIFHWSSTTKDFRSPGITLKLSEDDVKSSKWFEAIDPKVTDKHKRYDALIKWFSDNPSLRVDGLSEILSELNITASKLSIAQKKLRKAS